MVKTFQCKYHFSSQWYNQADDDYEPTSKKDHFTVMADTMDEAVKKAEAKVSRMNKANYGGDDPQEPMRFPTTSLKEVRDTTTGETRTSPYPKKAKPTVL